MQHCPQLLHLGFFLALEPTFLVAWNGHGSKSQLSCPHALRPGAHCSVSASNNLSILTRKLECDATFLLGFHEDKTQSWRQGPWACLAPGKTHGRAATNVLSEIKVRQAQLEGQGPPPSAPM